MKKSLIATLLIAAAATAQAQAQSAACAKTDAKEISALFDRWNASLATGNPDQVVANYAKDGVLSPTVSNKVRTNHAEIRDYFVHFLDKGPQGKIDTRIVKIGCNLAQDVGTYTFTFKDGSKVSGRYTYVYEFVNGQWLISHHHSSAMPEKAAAHSH
ncbi:SgcJ/EcaC family oxidoreductase [Roseateles sp. BYS180W]|uniref:SgcJ/EcaC family oxidoreductase n=1 Tax=Roseateles rivi TaxID=3299028 RepID=A0ABW7FRG6_9BURK